MSVRRLLVALSAAVLTIGLALPAVAQSKAERAKKGAGLQAETQARPQQQAQQAAGKKPAQRKVLRLEEMRVEGRVQKPQALFLMPRAGVSSGEQDRNESFLPKTKDALAKDPF